MMQLESDARPTPKLVQAGMDDGNENMTEDDVGHKPNIEEQEHRFRA